MPIYTRLDGTSTAEWAGAKSGRRCTCRTRSLAVQVTLWRTRESRVAVAGRRGGLLGGRAHPGERVGRGIGPLGDAGGASRPSGRAHPRGAPHRDGRARDPTPVTKLQA